VTRIARKALQESVPDASDENGEAISAQ
jgi:hypothetical protein